MLCSAKASILLHCAWKLAQADDAVVWLVGKQTLLRSDLLLGQGACRSDAAFERIKLHQLEAPHQVTKLFASMHLLPTEDLPHAIVIDDSGYEVMAEATGGTAGNERQIAFSAPLALP